MRSLLHVFGPLYNTPFMACIVGDLLPCLQAHSQQCATLKSWEWAWGRG